MRRVESAAFGYWAVKLASQGNSFQRQQLGLTLVELLIVVAIVGVLASIAYPSYQRHITNTRYADAKVKLLEIMQLQRRHFTNNNTFTTNLTGDLGYTDAGAGAVATDNEFYTITAAQCGVVAINECVLLTATATYGDGTETLTYNSRNQKSPDDAW